MEHDPAQEVDWSQSTEHGLRRRLMVMFGDTLRSGSCVRTAGDESWWRFCVGLLLCID